MKQILRFNKIIKSIIITGDLCILNALFVTLYYVLDTDTQRILLSDSLPQLLVLLNLVYLLCNYSKGVVLHRRIVRADHIVMRAVRNTFCHAVVFISLSRWCISAACPHASSLYSIRHSLYCLYYTDSYSGISSRYTAAREATGVLSRSWATVPIWSNSTKK